MIARPFALLMAVATAATMAACGTSSSNQPASAPGAAASSGPATAAAGGKLPDPCGLLSMDEIKAVVGKAPAATETSDAGDSLGGPTCTWNDSDGYSVFVLTVLSSPDAFERSTVSISKPVKGVGQDAHLNRLAGLYVKTATHTFYTQSQLPVADGQVSADIQAATKAAGTNEKPPVDEASFRLAKLVATRL
jgi:hypothetical protein